MAEVSVDPPPPASVRHSSSMLTSRTAVCLFCVAFKCKTPACKTWQTAWGKSWMGPEIEEVRAPAPPL